MLLLLGGAFVRVAIVALHLGERSAPKLGRANRVAEPPKRVCDVGHHSAATEAKSGVHVRSRDGGDEESKSKEACKHSAAKATPCPRQSVAYKYRRIARSPRAAATAALGANNRTRLSTAPHWSAARHARAAEPRGVGDLAVAERCTLLVERLNEAPLSSTLPRKCPKITRFPPILLRRARGAPRFGGPFETECVETTRNYIRNVVGTNKKPHGGRGPRVTSRAFL